MEHNQDPLNVAKFAVNIKIIILNLHQVSDCKGNQENISVAFEVIGGELPPPVYPVCSPKGHYHIDQDKNSIFDFGLLKNNFSCRAWMLIWYQSSSDQSSPDPFFNGPPALRSIILVCEILLQSRTVADRRSRWCGPAL